MKASFYKNSFLVQNCKKKTKKQIQNSFKIVSITLNISLIIIIFMRKAFVLAGGRGLRLGSITNSIPKPLMKIAGKTVLEWNILNFKNHGVKQVIVSIGYLGEKIVNHFKDKDLGLELIFDTEPFPLGTAGALKHASQYFDDTFYFCNGDEAKNVDYSKALKFHKQNNALATICLTKVIDVENFGVVKMQNSHILEFVEKPPRDQAPSNLISSGASIINPLVFDLIESEKKVSIEKEIYPIIAKQNKLFGLECLLAWQPIDTPEKYKKAKKEWKGF